MSALPVFGRVAFLFCGIVIGVSGWASFSTSDWDWLKATLASALMMLLFAIWDDRAERRRR